MLIVTLKLGDLDLRKIPVGKTTDASQLRKSLVRQYHADVACPVTTGISLRVVAEAAYIELKQWVDASEVAPFLAGHRPRQSAGFETGLWACVFGRVARERTVLTD